MAYSNFLAQPSRTGYVNIYDTLNGKFSDPLHPKATTTASADGTIPPVATTGGTSTPDLSSLTAFVNQLNQQGQTSAEAARIPGATALETQSSGNIASELAGQLPPDVVNQLQQAAAERGVAIGSPGSPNVDSNFLLNYLGGSLGLQRQGQSDLSAALARNPTAPIFDPTSQLLTPYQSGVLSNQSALLGLDWFKALNPTTARGGGGGTGGGEATQPTATSGPNLSTLASLLAGLNPAGSTTTGTTLQPGIDYSNPFGFTTTDPTGATSTLDWTGQNFGDLFGNPAGTTTDTTTTGGGLGQIVDPSQLYDPGSELTTGGG